MNRFILLVLACFLLAGCGNDESPVTPETGNGGSGSSDGQADSDQTILIEKSDFSIELPKNWREFSPDEFSADSHALALFRRTEADGGSFPNIVLTRDSIPRSVTPLEFSRKTIENESVILIGYQKLNETTVSISGQQAPLIEFSARASPEAVPMRFLQLFLVNDGTGYVFTAGTSQKAGDTVISEMRSILGSVQLPYDR